MTEVLAHYGTKADLSKEASANSRLVDDFFCDSNLRVYLC